MLKFLKNLSAGATEAKRAFLNPLAALFKIKKIDDSSVHEIERVLYASDFGVEITRSIISEIKIACKKDSSIYGGDMLRIASAVVAKSLANAEGELPAIGSGGPSVICLVGTNGSGKTTTAAKLAHFYGMNGHSVLLAGCDTFRAAAQEQIQAWADRLGVDIVSGQPGGDAAAIAYDAYQSALAKKHDILIADTAGRLHVKSNLMAELHKISKILKKLNENLQINNWLVIDCSIGANSMESAKMFHDAIGLHGLILSKFDGTSRGGTIVGIREELKIPILFLGTGERPEDIVRFSVDGYIAELFGKDT
jgi:fused signal recognition particle receptor